MIPVRVVQAKNTKVAMELFLEDNRAEIISTLGEQPDLAVLCLIVSSDA